jgi:hypothetical protein
MQPIAGAGVGEAYGQGDSAECTEYGWSNDGLDKEVKQQYNSFHDVELVM